MEEYGFWKNLIDDVKHSSLIKLSIVITLISGVLSTLIVAYLTNNKIDIDKKKLYIFVAFIILYYFIVIVYYGIKHITIYAHNTFITSLYGDIIKNITQWNYELKILSQNGATNNAEFIKKLKLICNGLKDFFDKKTHSTCSVSIKLSISLEGDISTWEFKNICRDDKSVYRDTEQYNSTVHNVMGNTAYDQIIDNLLRKRRRQIAYINNNIPNSPDYQNTSKFDDDTILPYKSEIVYPIMRLHTFGRDTKMCGFICIDSNMENKFGHFKYDETILEGITDNLYDVLTLKIR